MPRVDVELTGTAIGAVAVDGQRLPGQVTDVRVFTRLPEPGHLVAELTLEVPTDLVQTHEDGLPPTPQPPVVPDLIQPALEMQEVLLRFIGGEDPRCSAGARELAEHAVQVARELAAAAVYRVLARLTTQEPPITFGRGHDAAPAAEIVRDFCETELAGAEPNHRVFERIRRGGR